MGSPSKTKNLAFKGKSVSRRAVSQNGHTIGKSSVTVLPSKAGWILTEANTGDAISFSSKREAIDAASAAVRNGGTLVIQGRNGQILRGGAVSGSISDERIRKAVRTVADTHPPKPRR